MGGTRSGGLSELAAGVVVVLVVVAGVLGWVRSEGETAGTGAATEGDAARSGMSANSSTTAMSPSMTAPPLTTTAAPPTASGASIIDGLVVAPEGSDAGYERDLFEHWIDADGDGCDTRCEVLEAERRSDLPGLAAGGWLSVYDGYTTPDAGELDIDHVVALGEAWRSGASTWDPGKRQAFANDLDDPRALIAVSAATNGSKSDRDPVTWQPPDQAAWCDYAIAWATTKARWELTVDQAELEALRNMVRGC